MKATTKFTAQEFLSLNRKHSFMLTFYLQESYQTLSNELRKVCEIHGEKLLDTKHNPISLGKLIS